MSIDIERFWEKVDKEGSVPSHVPEIGNCWVWTGSKDKRHNHAYGFFGVDGKVRSAHRVAWEIANGPITGGLFVLHRCDNPSCVRASHLFLGTHEANMADRKAKGRTPNPPIEHNTKKTNCINGHPYSGYNLSIVKVGNGQERRCKTCMRETMRRLRANRRSA